MHDIGVEEGNMLRIDWHGVWGGLVGMSGFSTGHGRET